MSEHLGYSRLISRVEELTGGRRTTENTWQEIADNLLGRRDFTVNRMRGEQRLQRIYDDTSKVSGCLLAGAMQSLLTSPSARWFALRFENAELAEVHRANIWLKAAEQRLYAAMSAPNANFHAQLAETYIDLIFFGTGGIFKRRRK